MKLAFCTALSEANININENIKHINAMHNETVFDLTAS